MALTTSQVITLRGPQFAGDPRISDMITLAKEELNQTAFGESYNKAIAYQVLHWLTLESMSGGNPGTGTTSGQLVGGIESKSEGDLSVTFSKTGNSGSSLSARNDDLSSTQFGKELLKLMRSSIMTFRNNTI